MGLLWLHCGHEILPFLPALQLCQLDLEIGRKLAEFGVRDKEKKDKK